VVLLIPNFCVGEVFAVFAKYHLAKWDPRIKRIVPRGISKPKYNKIREQFRNDLHNGMLLQEVDLDRTHMKATDLITPVDANFEFYRATTNARKSYKRMMSAADHSIIGMGIQLSKTFGKEAFAILTADHRLADILTRASSVNRNTAQKLGLIQTAEELGLDYGPSLYPHVMNLVKARKRELSDFFGVWPLSETAIVPELLTNLTKRDCQLLSDIRKRRGMSRDSLPYTEEFEAICREFERMKGQRVDRNTAWKGMLRVEKAPKKRSR
jgi:hypothetical protein